MKDPKKNMALANLSIYYIWKNIKSEYSNNKFKISAPSWKDTFDVTNGNITLKDFRKYEKLEYEKNKLKLVIDFLNNCKQLGVYPKFLITASLYNTSCNRFYNNYVINICSGQL